MNCFVPLYAATAHNLSQGANTHPLPRIGDFKRYLIRQRPHFIADFLIRSIIGTFENDGGVLFTLDFLFFDEPLLLRTDAFQQNAGGLVIRVLRHELALNSHLEN